jgi:hypothetical protein
MRKGKFTLASKRRQKQFDEDEPEDMPEFDKYVLMLNGNELTTDQRAHFIMCVDKVYNVNRRIIFRGEKKASILKTYGIKNSGFPKEFNASLFIMGNKARMFTMEENQALNEINISEATGNVFSHIFRMISDLVQKQLRFSANRNVLESFKKREIQYRTFFLNPDNEFKLIEATNAMSYDERIRIRDYYLALLHHIDKSQYYSSSFLISTTRYWDVAHGFAWKDEEEGSENPIILFGWIPDKYEGVLRAASLKILIKEINMEELGLPVYNYSFYPNQGEVTLKGVLFADYLLGYLHYSEGKMFFEINPAIFKVNDSWNGKDLSVNQNSFHQKMQNSLFARFLTFNPEDGNYQQYRKL